MIQCEDCEFFRRGADGSPHLTCDPFSNVKEPECIAKWQLIQLTTVAQSHQATLEMYKRLAPLQEKMFRHVEREIDEADRSDEWKYGQTDDDNDEEEENDDPFHA